MGWKKGALRVTGGKKKTRQVLPEEGCAKTRFPKSDGGEG